jgi:hypothetical protein
MITNAGYTENFSDDSATQKLLLMSQSVDSDSFLDPISSLTPMFGDLGHAGKQNPNEVFSVNETPFPMLQIEQPLQLQKDKGVTHQRIQFSNSSNIVTARALFPSLEHNQSTTSGGSSDEEIMPLMLTNAQEILRSIDESMSPASRTSDNAIEFLPQSVMSIVDPQVNMAQGVLLPLEFWDACEKMGIHPSNIHIPDNVPDHMRLAWLQAEIGNKILTQKGIFDSLQDPDFSKKRRKIRHIRPLNETEVGRRLSAVSHPKGFVTR